MALYFQAHEEKTYEIFVKKKFFSLKIESQIKATCEENMEGVRAVYAHVKPSGNCRMCHIDAICSYDDSANAFRYLFTKFYFREVLLIEFA